jgi:Mn2+/Fe2+ NRAMP family transporter
MKNKVDWFYLRKPLIIFFAGLVVAILLGVAGTQYQNTQQYKYEQSLSSLRTMHRLYSNLIKDIDLLEQYRNQYAD